MAKKTENTIDESKKIEAEKDETVVKNTISDLIKLLDAESASEITTTDWVSTGIKSLNFLLSGDIDKGIPAGKMTVIAGEQQSGKSFLAARMAAHAQKKGYIVLWLDSEHASDKLFLSRMGLNVAEVIYPKVVDTVEDLQNICIKALNRAKEKKLKFFIVLDSLGALSSQKETIDADAEKLVADMGARAKNIRVVFKQLIHRLPITNSIFFCINHVYISPGFIPKKEMSGGSAPWLLGQIVLFLTKLKGEEGVFSRVKMKSKKNREFIEGRMVEFEINFRKGIDPNSGLIDLLEEFEVIKKAGAWYKIEGDDKSYREETILKDEILLAKLLANLREKSKDYTYSSFAPIS